MLLLTPVALSFCFCFNFVRFNFMPHGIIHHKFGSNLSQQCGEHDTTMFGFVNPQDQGCPRKESSLSPMTDDSLGGGVTIWGFSPRVLREEDHFP